MATHDYIISNASGAAVRADLNNALAAIASNNSAATEPTTTYAYQWWADTGSSPTVMKLRNAANSAWITLFQLDGEWSLIPFENGTAAAPSIYFKDSGTDTGIFSPGADQVGISTGGTSRFEISTSATTSTLPVVHPLGAVATPSITFTGDLNTGIWSPAADTIAFSEGGTEAMRIDSSGRLGIGTTPAALFDANGLGRFLSASPSYPASGKGLEIYYDSSGDLGYIQTYDRGASAWKSVNLGGASVRFNISGNEAARIDSSSRLLVGTSTAPTAGDAAVGLLRVQGFVGSATGEGIASIARGKVATSMISGETVGQLIFTDNAGNPFAKIYSTVDGTVSSTSDLPGSLSFSTTADGASSPTERMRINTGGATGFFNAGDTVWSASSTGAGTVQAIHVGSHSAAGVFGGTVSYKVFTNGNVQNTNGSYTTLSDAKLKENIVDAGSQWDDLKAIQIRNWNFKEETGHETHRQIGPIAQELETVCPGLVFETPDRDEDGNETGEVTKGVNQSVLYMKAVKALQEAMERIEQLETKVAALENA